MASRETKERFGQHFPREDMRKASSRRKRWREACVTPTPQPAILPGGGIRCPTTPEFEPKDSWKGLSGFQASAPPTPAQQSCSQPPTHPTLPGTRIPPRLAGTRGQRPSLIIYWGNCLGHSPSPSLISHCFRPGEVDSTKTGPHLTWALVFK